MAKNTIHVIYQTQPAARKLFEWILRTGVEDDRTTVEGLVEQCEVSRRHAINVLRELAEGGYGEFKVGRKGHPSRLEWATDPIALAELAIAGGGAGGGDDGDGGGDDDDDADGRGGDEHLVPAPQPEPEPEPPRFALRPSNDAVLDMFPHETPPAKAPTSAPRRASSSRDHGLIDHSYVLRPGLRIVVPLPEDLSAREAQVLGDWLRNLSFER